MKGWKRSLISAAGLAALSVGALGSKVVSNSSGSGGAASASASAPAASSVAATTSASAAPSASAASTAAADTGKHITYRVLPTKNTGLQLLQTLFDSKDYPGPQMVAALDKDLVWPNNVVEQFRDCGAVNSMYIPDDHSVNLCYELAGYFYQTLPKLMKGASPTKVTIDAMIFTQLHETGHALIKEMNIGAMGNEETDVDGFATVVLLKGGLGQVAIDGAVAMLSLLGITGTKPDYLNEHPPSQERFAEILCMVYGSDPTGYAKLVADHVVDADRAPKCQAEYENTAKVWQTLLAPHERAK
jgi:hypothetical protein